jgi:NAD+ diphosphatase
MEDARWFTRDEVAEAMAARDRARMAWLSAPSKTAVAWHLMADWLGF